MCTIINFMLTFTAIVSINIIITHIKFISIATDRAVSPSNRLSLDFNFGCSGAESELNECSYQLLNEHTSCYLVIVSCTPCEAHILLLHSAVYMTIKNCHPY